MAEAESAVPVQTGKPQPRDATSHFAGGSVPVIVIKPSRGWSSLGLRDVWEYRELLYFLVWRDLKARYKQTALGAAWAVIQPLVTTIIFTVIFSYLARIPSEGIPYPIFSYAALLPWNYFAHSLDRVSNSVVNSAQLITKVFFPRLVIPISAVLSGLVDFAIAFMLLIVLMVYYGFRPTAGLALLPAFVLLAMITALGVGLWMSALNVYYRDVKYVTSFLIQVWMYATPIIYPVSMVPERFRLLYGLNPMMGVVEGFRWALLGHTSAPDSSVAVSSLVAAVVLVSGALYFRRMERTFADVV
jgi:lipopolysaccharide transport system permease protein